MKRNKVAENQGLVLSIKSANTAVVESHQISQYLSGTQKAYYSQKARGNCAFTSVAELWVPKHRFAKYRTYVLSIIFQSRLFVQTVKVPEAEPSLPSSQR